MTSEPRAIDSTAARAIPPAPGFLASSLRIFDLSIGEMLWSRRTIFMVLLVGTLALLDFQALGWTRVTRRLTPWTHTGLLIVLTTGPVMFFADVPRYTSNRACLIKMAVLAAALVFQFTVRRRKDARWAAAASLIMWSSVILAGRAIADFDL